MLLRLTPILLAVLVGLAIWFFSSWRLRRELDSRSTPLTDPVLTAQIGRLAEVLEVPRIAVHIYEIPVINGLAAPDGRVFITRGFLDRYRRGAVTAEEIVSVVAHELGHVSLGHARRRMIDFSGQNAVRVILGAILGRFLPFVGVWLANVVASLIAARLSRRDEFEADAYAAALMVKAGFGVAPQVSMFRKLGQMAPKGNAPVWLMSHPRVEDRIAAIERLADGWGLPRA